MLHTRHKVITANEFRNSIVKGEPGTRETGRARAFAICDHPRVIPVLLDILEYGTKLKQRRAAAFALARLDSPLAIEPLCKAAGLGDRSIGPEAAEALSSMGRADYLARLVLSEI